MVNRLKPFVKWMGLVILLALIYDGAIFYSRWSADRAFEERKAEAEAARLRQNVARAGDDSLRIASLYSSPSVVRAGEAADLCYSVRGASKVTLDPPVAEVWPSLTRCVEVKPRKTTEYKLTASNDAGQSVTETFELKVVR